MKNPASWRFLIRLRFNYDSWQWVTFWATRRLLIGEFIILLSVPLSSYCWLQIQHLSEKESTGWLPALHLHHRSATSAIAHACAHTCVVSGRRLRILLCEIMIIRWHRWRRRHRLWRRRQQHSCSSTAVSLPPVMSELPHISSQLRLKLATRSINIR